MNGVDGKDGQDYTPSSSSLNTNIQISQAKGENFLSRDAIYEVYAPEQLRTIHYMKSGDFGESWYKKSTYSGSCSGTSSWGQYTKMAYDTTACPNDFYNVDSRVQDLVDKYFKYENIPKYTMVASHDQFVAPLLISVTNRKIGLEYHGYGWNYEGFNHWPNYLAGVAIIVNEQNEVDYVPVRGLNTGYLGEHCVNGTEKRIHLQPLQPLKKRPVSTGRVCESKVQS